MGEQIIYHLIMWYTIFFRENETPPYHLFYEKHHHLGEILYDTIKLTISK